MKQCSSCHEFKHYDEFSKNQGAKDGYQSWCKRCFQTRYYNNRENIKNYMRLRNYNLRSYEYDDLLERQGHVCAICRQPATSGGKGLVVDHDHFTGAVRGLLCQRHNLGLALLGDDRSGLEAALEYLNCAL